MHSYDRSGITLDHFRVEPESFRNVAAADLAEPGSIGDWDDPDEVARLHDLQDDYFLVALEECDTIGTGRGFDSGGCVMPGMEVAGSATADTTAGYFRSR